MPVAREKKLALPTKKLQLEGERHAVEAAEKEANEAARIVEAVAAAIAAVQSREVRYPLTTCHG